MKRLILTFLIITTSYLSAAYYIRLGFDMDATKILYDAIKRRDIRAAQLAITDGADVNAKNSYQRTPLHTAAFNNAANVAELLIRHGADVNARDNNQWTPLHTAAFKNTTNIAELLIRHGADVNARGDFQRTPLHFATIYNAANVAELLIQHDADVNTRDDFQRIPLHTAASRNATDVAELLIRHGADVNARNRTHKTSLDMAIALHATDTTKELLTHNATIPDHLPTEIIAWLDQIITEINSEKEKFFKEKSFPSVCTLLHENRKNTGLTQTIAALLASEPLPLASEIYALRRLQRFGRAIIACKQLEFYKKNQSADAWHNGLVQPSMSEHDKI